MAVSDLGISGMLGTAAIVFCDSRINDELIESDEMVRG